MFDFIIIVSDYTPTMYFFILFFWGFSPSTDAMVDFEMLVPCT